MSPGDDTGPASARMLALPRTSVLEIDIKSVPRAPGVYAWFRQGAPVYGGKASGEGGLRDRIGKHLGLELDLSRSSLRRNVAEHLLSVPTVKSARAVYEMNPSSGVSVRL